MQHHTHRVEQTLDIECPIEQCYKLLIHFEQYPEFIPGLRIENKGDEGTWQWTLSGPEGQEIAWELKLDALRHQHNVISWHTIRIADVAHSGAITLESKGDNHTRLHFVVEYEPSAEFYRVALGSKDPQFSDELFVQQADQAIIRALENFRASIIAEQSTVKPGGG